MQSDRQREIGKRVHLSAHLLELRTLVGREVASQDILSLEQTDALQAASRTIPKSPNAICSLPFEAKAHKSFAALIGELEALRPGPVLLWTSHSSDCGVLEVESIARINFDFPYAVNSTGTIAVTTRDCRDKMILDFSENSNGQRVIDIELYGSSWARAKLPVQ